MAFVECSAHAPADRRGRTNRLFTTLLCLAFLCLFVIATAGSAFAQPAPAAPATAQDPSPKEIGRLIDSLETPEGMAVHAYLHRKEGVEWNADYWYGRAGRRFHRPAPEDEWAALVEGLS